MKSKWLVYAKKADFKAIEQKYGIDQVIARIMRNRDVCTDEEMQMYLNGSIDGLHAPELLKDAQKAVDILTEKIAQHKKIRIIGDYDIDGICSITILYKALKKAGADVDYVVPHRITDGPRYPVYRGKRRKETADVLRRCNSRPETAGL